VRSARGRRSSSCSCRSILRQDGILAWLGCCDTAGETSGVFSREIPPLVYIHLLEAIRDEVQAPKRLERR
jgi:hypothetical protein